MFGTCGGMGGLSGEITIVLGAAPRPAFIGRGPTTINNGSIEHIGVSLGGLGGRAGQAGLDGGPGITAIVYDENDIVLPFGPSPVYKFPLSEVQTGNRIERLGWGVEFTVPGQWRIYLRNNYNGKFRGDVSFWTKDNDPAGTYGELNGALQKWAQGDAPTYTIKQEVNSWQSLYNGSIAAMQPGTRYGCIVEHHNHVSAIFVQRNADDTIEFGSELIQEWPWFDAYTTKLYYMPGGTRIDRGGFRWEYDSGYDTLATRVATSDGTKFYGEIETWYTSSSALLESSIGGYRANPNAPSARITSEQLGYTLFAAVTTAAGVDEKQGRVVRWTDYKTGKQSVWAIWWSKSYNIEFTFVCEELPKYEWIDVYEKHLAGVPLGVFARAGGVGWEYDGTYVYIFGRTRDSADKFYGTIKCWFRSNYLDENIASWQASPAQQELTLVDGPGEIRLIGVPFTTGAGRKVGAVIEWNKKVFALWWETNPVNGDFSCACDPIEQYL
jgi:hypothetical protein